MKPRWALFALLGVALGCEAVLGIGPTHDETPSAGGTAGASSDDAAGVGGIKPVGGNPGADGGNPGAQGGNPGPDGDNPGANGGAAGDSRSRAGATGEAPVPMGGAGGLDLPMVTAGNSSTAWPVVSSERTFRVSHRWPARQQIWVCVQYDPGGSMPPKDFWSHAQALVEDTWLRVSDVPLSFVGDCSSGPIAQIVVTVGANLETFTELGYPGVGVRDMTLNSAASDAEVLYVFGRALGFEHEFGREKYAGACLVCESAADCTQPGRPTCLPSGFCGNELDHGSIMGAPDCGGIENIRTFTRWDALGAQRAYERKPSGTIVGSRNRCLDAEGGLPAPGASMIRYPCANADNERWSRIGAASGSLLQATIGRQEVCLSVSSQSTLTLPLLTATCDATLKTQLFQLSPVNLQTLGGLCIAAKGSTPGSLLWTAECGTSSPSTLEQWTIADSSIQLQGSNQCITVRNGSATQANELELQDCGSAPLWQSFSFVDGEIRFAGNQVCFNVIRGTPQPGNPIQLYSGCGYHLENEAFFAHGSIRTGAATCVDSLDPLDKDNINVGVSRCNDSSSQQWDYYW